MYKQKRGMYIPKEELKKQFNPFKHPRETYLLCTLKWGENGRLWTHWVRNDADDICHAEVYFLKKIFEPRRFSDVTCYMTWYLSWSPCPGCCYEIQRFLRRNPYVSLDIRVARLYYINYEAYRRGLQNLMTWVELTVMDTEDYINCLGEFGIDDRDYDDDYDDDDDDDYSWIETFQSEITRNCLKLWAISQGTYY